jgi:hypothetical protein
MLAGSRRYKDFLYISFEFKIMLMNGVIIAFSTYRSNQFNSFWPIIRPAIGYAIILLLVGRQHAPTPLLRHF